MSAISPITVGRTAAVARPPARPGQKIKMVMLGQSRQRAPRRRAPPGPKRTPGAAEPITKPAGQRHGHRKDEQKGDNHKDRARQRGVEVEGDTAKRNVDDVVADRAEKRPRKQAARAPHPLRAGRFVVMISLQRCLDRVADLPTSIVSAAPGVGCCREPWRCTIVADSLQPGDHAPAWATPRVASAGCTICRPWHVHLCRRPRHLIGRNLTAQQPPPLKGTLTWKSTSPPPIGSISRASS